jgi:hypothetical protein
MLAMPVATTSLLVLASSQGVHQRVAADGFGNPQGAVAERLDALGRFRRLRRPAAVEKVPDAEFA